MMNAQVIPFEQLPEDLQGVVNSIMESLGDGGDDGGSATGDEIIDNAALTMTTTAIGLVFDAHETLRKADELLTHAERLSRLVDNNGELKRDFIFEVMESILPVGVLLEEAMEEIEDVADEFTSRAAADEKASQVH